MSIMEMCQWLQDTSFGTYLRESIYMFPAVEGTHVLALAISVGVVFWFDLRLLGLNMRRQPVSHVRSLLPWMIGGSIVMYVTGFLLFWCQAAKAWGSIFFKIKLVALLLAGINIWFFHWYTERSLAEWDKSPIPPAQARMAGLFSIILWIIVITTGRLMAYTF